MMRTTRFENRASEWEGDLTVWLRQNAEDNQEQRERLLKNLRRAMREELTERQAQMIHMYFFDNKTIPQIAAELGLNRSTVSRTLKRGKARLSHTLQYSI